MIKGQEEFKNGAEQRKGKSPAEGHYPHLFKRTFSAFDYKNIISALAMRPLFGGE